jgi:hypothetical protein
MTLLWTSLIVIGLAMIVVAVWPSIRGLGKHKPAADEATPADDPKREGV